MSVRRKPAPEPHHRNGHEAPRTEDREPPAPSPGEGTAVEAPRRVRGDSGTGIPQRREVIDPPPLGGTPRACGPGSEIPDPLTFDQLMRRQMPEPAVLVDGVLHQGSKMVISGGSKSYKTWMLLDLAVSVATGGEWLGKQTTKGGVLFVNFELQDFFYRKRMVEVLAAKGIEESEIQDTLFYVGLRGINVGNALTLVDILHGRTTHLDLKLIILDPLYKMLGDRDENSAGDMADLMGYLDKLARETGAAVVFGHHFSKGNQASKDMRDRGAGSGAIMRDADSIMTVTPHKEEDAFIVECVPRNFPPWQSFVVRRQHPLMVVDDEADSRDFRQPSRGARPQEFPDEEVLALLDAAPLRQTDWRQRAEEELGMSKSTFNNRLRQLREDNAVVLEGNLYKRAERTGSPVREAIRRSTNQS